VGSTSNYTASNGLNLLWTIAGKDEGTIYTPEYPITVSYRDTATNTLVAPLQNITKEKMILPFPVPSRAGNYEIQLKDAVGIQGTQFLTILPSNPSKLKLLPASTHFLAKTELPVSIQLLDDFDNLVEASLSQVKVQIARGSFVNESPATTAITASLFEGSTLIPVTSSEI
jgi:hypothetical protein